MKRKSDRKTTAPGLIPPRVPGLALALALCLALLLAGCGAGSGNGGAEDAESGTAADSGTEGETGTDDVERDNPFPDLHAFTARTLDGETFTQSDFAGYDLTAINIWATWCGPCLRDMPDLAALRRALPRAIRLITFCTDGVESAETADYILRNADFGGVTLVSADGDLETLLQSVLHIPTTVFVDSAGNMVSDAVIRAQTPLEEVYLRHINKALSAMGKPELS